MTTSSTFLTRFADVPNVEKFALYFEILYGSYDANWTDRVLLQAKCDAVTEAGFRFNKALELVWGTEKSIDLNPLTDADRLTLFNTLFTTANLDLMIWWIYEHLGTQWLQYIRGLDLFLNSMRMVGETVTNPMAKDSSGKLGEVVEDELWLKKIKVYIEAEKVQKSLVEQRRSLLMNMDAEQKLLDVVLTNQSESSDLEMAKAIKLSRKNAIN